MLRLMYTNEGTNFYAYAVGCSELQCVAVCVAADLYGATLRVRCVYSYSCPGNVQCVAVCCSVLQCVAVCCSALQCVAVWAVCCSVLQCPGNLLMSFKKIKSQLLHFKTDFHGDRNTLQHTATHCNTLQDTATHCNTLQHTATHCNTLQHTATHCNTLRD